MNNKAAGEDGIEAESLKYGGNKMEETLYGLIKEIWIEEEVPMDWSLSIT